jgi:hypothetical protein
VANANALVEPNFEANIWGVVTIDAERIMYRYRDTENNTISGLLRGTAGTAITEHAVGAIVYNMSRGNLLSEDYQDYIVSNSTLGDGSTTTFTADDIDLSSEDVSVQDGSLEVYVGGTRVTEYTITSYNPAEIEFDTINAGSFVIGGTYTITTVGTTDFTQWGAANNNVGTFFVATGVGTGTGTATITPANGVEVTMLVRRGVTWYAPGAGTPSNGVALQETDTKSARFLRGL